MYGVPPTSAKLYGFPKASPTDDPFVLVETVLRVPQVIFATIHRASPTWSDGSGGAADAADAHPTSKALNFIFDEPSSSWDRVRLGSLARARARA